MQLRSINATCSVVGQFESNRVHNGPGRNLAFLLEHRCGCRREMTHLGAMIRARYSRTKGRNWEARYDSIVGQKLVAAGIVWRF
jgi:hypothetical protein